ncbi:hypothetical protein ONS96_002277 [Cadophora gregata f. sp. sojae]|nr:hypothetical protein ONS96_002277 [Cadophora gregata f. sp. sojae]
MAPTPFSQEAPIDVGPPQVPITTSPLKQLRAPPIPFVPRSESLLSSSSPPSEVLQVEFYNCRPEAPAIFSTRYGTRAKRRLVQPYPAPIIRTNALGDVAIKSNQLLEEFPDAQNFLNVPFDWLILHDFFDGYDLWVEGATFCFHVMLAICGKNITRHEELAQVSHDQRLEIDRFANDWVCSHSAIVRANLKVEKMTTLFNDVDRAELIGMTEAEITILNQGLDYHRQHYLEYFTQSTRTPMEPRSSFPYHDQQMINQEGYAISAPDVSLNRTSMVHQTMPQAQRVRQDPISLVPSCAAQDQQLVRRSSFQGQQAHHHAHGYNVGFDTRRHITPNVHRIQGYANNVPGAHRSQRHRGLSNSSQNARGREFSYIYSQGNNRRYPSDIEGHSSGNTPSKEPVYVRQKSPLIQHASHISAANRVVSDPAPTVPFYSAKRLGGSVRRVISPLNRERKFHNTQSMSTSPVSNGYPRTPRRYPSGSSPIQGPRILPVSPINCKPQSNDARINATTEREYPWMEHHDTNNSLTLHYRPGCRDYESLRTLHISGFHEAMFYDHFLKESLEECGKVISIHYLPLGAPRAFVTFVESSSVQAAILRYNQTVLPSGHKLSAGVPNNLDRPRAGSNASQSYRNGQYNSSRDFEPRSRRHSFRNSLNGYHTGTSSRRPSVVQSPNTPPSLLVDQLRSTINEVVNHQSALERHVYIPLGRIDNIQNLTKAGNGVVGIQQPIMGQTGNNTKENVSPSKKAASQVNRENVSPRKNTSNKKSSCKHQKGSKQNTSTRPTPAVTPVKSNSVADLKEVKKLHISTELLKSSIGNGPRKNPRNDVKKNSFKPKNLHDSSKSDGSFNTDSTSDATLSPLDSRPMTQDISFSAGSGRKHSQASSAKISKSRSAVDVPSLARAITSKLKSKTNNKSRGHKQNPNILDEQVKTAVEDTVEAPKEVETEDKKDKGAVMGYSKKASGVSITSNHSLRKADGALAQAVTNELCVSASSPEVKSMGSKGKLEDPTLGIDAVNPSSISPEILSPQINDKEWPSLAKSQVMPSDVERLPPPVMGPLTSVPAGNKKSTKSAVPAVAVPRAFETRLQQP